ncbi:GNAT family N-acetyltransferase [Rhodococcus oxybenzonivorans]|uniref:GNAT family N-acetyltransferase n=1 Tax=Rhodococcus oxybenzonivorans TaxID=1990687 RepID=UPI002955AF68|nr:GNAT family N-acetyltransferase [Rhodococcus oxybenzonivorans]MDV7353545.1 GNAT family N-acetyltransferase [Rhodococcus oxybenzonivorans]
MRVTAHEISLTQRHVWRSAREAIPIQRALVIEVEQDGATGFGEASAFMTAHYNSGVDQLHADLRRIAPLLADLGPDDPFAVWRRLFAALPDSPFVLAALDTAVHDLRARLLGVPLWQALALDSPQELRSSFSIGLDETEMMVHKLCERPGWAAYKIKLADPGDLTVLEELRRHTSAPFYVDGNCGWTLSRLLPVLPALQDLGVQLIEQPFPRSAWWDTRTLKQHSPIPVIADESITSMQDFAACAEAFDGINVKPMKAGGITPSLVLLRRAREHGLLTMLGCMPESVAGVSATAHLGGLADYLDVDAVDLLAVNTGFGVSLDGSGRVSLPDRPGSGYLPDPTAHGWRVRPVSAEAVRPVRHRVLRPGQPVATCAYPEDSARGARHFAALDAGRVVGVASLYDEDPEYTVPGLAAGRGRRLRGMATLEEVRGTGAGSALLRTVRTNAVLSCADALWCNARTTAAGFYLAQGFRVLGPEYDIPGIGPHVFMYWSAS